MNTFILVMTFIMFFVYLIIFVVMRMSNGRKISKYFTIMVGSLMLSAAWLLMTEIALISDVLIETAGREIRPFVNRAILLFGGVYFLYGLLKR